MTVNMEVKMSNEPWEKYEKKVRFLEYMLQKEISQKQGNSVQSDNVYELLALLKTCKK
jgi:hypothetical protein